MAGGSPDRDRTATALEVMDALEEQGVRAVILGFVDPSAIVRVKCVPISRFPAAADTGVGLSTLFNVATSSDGFAELPGYIDGPSGDLRVIADPDATVPLIAMPGWAWSQVDQHTQDGEVYAGCPRSFLRRAVEKVSGAGLSVRAAYEFEFSAGRDLEDGGVEPAHRGPGYSDSALIANHELALDLITTLEEQGLGMQQFHPEFTEGQFEISIAPRDPLAAADVSIVLRESVRAVARRHGWRTSFSPRTFGPVGNGVHLHLSLWDGDRNVLAGGNGPEGLTDVGESFVAGILRELRAIVAITCPSPISYLRLQPHHWSGATQCWGLENREAAIRFIRGMGRTGPDGTNVEVKPIDGTANPFLALGAILAAGLDGIRKGDRLPPATIEDPSGLPDTERARRGVRLLPTSLPEAIEELAGSEVLRDAMGEFLFETFLETRRQESEHYRDMQEADIIRFYRWRY
jgi:glutamine synthetase